MAEISTESSGKKAEKGSKRRIRRLRIRLDMTPMVDIAFLLLIFYMVTTVFAAPQAIEINPPDETGHFDIRRSNILVIRVDDSGQYWLSKGDAGENLYRIEKKNLRDSLVSANRQNMLLSTLVKIHPRADFACYVDIIDEITRAESILQNDREYVEEYLVKNVEALGLGKFSDTIFSYRYALDSWHPEKDDQAIQRAIENRQALKDRRRP